MSTDLSKHGLCPIPFLQESLFPSEGGYVQGRTCSSIDLAGTKLSCCLPCPQVYWRYREGFMSRAEAANWIALVGFIGNAFILITYAVLPVKYSHRHYLNICLIASLMLMELAFIVPLGARPKECHNAITPNDMKSELTCAFTSALILGGGWSVILWSFCRTLYLHVQICWDFVPGQLFFLGTMGLGWGIPIAGVAIGLAVTGSSYRFGTICHINHDLGVYTFWGPLMGFAAATLIIHVATLGYCIHVYVKSVLDRNPTTNNSSNLPSTYSGSVRTRSARQTYRRVKKVLELQWRGIAVVLTIVGNLIFFAVIFLSLDNAARRTPENIARSQPWILCLVASKGNRNKCAGIAATLGPGEAAVMAVLVLLAFSGFWTVVFLGHVSMITGWGEWIKSKTRRNKDFVSVDAQLKPGQREYEMLSADRQHVLKSPEPLLTPTRHSDHSVNTTMESYPVDAENITHEAKYHSPPLSFSSPRPPSLTRTMASPREWDPKATFARGKNIDTYQSDKNWKGPP